MESVEGLTVWVKLKQPHNNEVFGRVLNLVPNSHLTLQQVLFPGSNTRLEHWTVQSTAIEDLQVVDASSIPRPNPPPPSTMPPQHSHAHPPHPPFPYPQQQPNGHHSAPPMHPQHIPGPMPAQANRIAELPARQVSSPNPLATQQLPAAVSPQRQAPAFVDPAILSYDTTSPAPKRRTSKPAEMETPIKSMLARAAANLPSPGSPFIGDISKANMAQKLAAVKQAAAAQQQPPVPVASKPSVEVALGDSAQDQAQETSNKKKLRRGQRTKKQTPGAAQAADPAPIMNIEVSRNGNDMNGQVKRGKGWRSTPLLQPSPSTTGPVEIASGKKNKRKQKSEQQQEFAQGDTTDIQDMGDFDFESELKKFDKKQVFDEIRQGDTTADEDRLVSHNKARPGTHGGKNLHPTENVLSPKLETKYNSNELDSSSDADTELGLHVANGRSSSKHSVSRTVFPMTKPSRQNSAQLDPHGGRQVHPHPLAASHSSDRARNRSTTSLATRGKQAMSLATSSPRPDHRTNSPHSAVSMTKSALREPSKIAESHFAIAPHMSVCPTLLPKALENLETATVSTYGLSHDAISESAARSIAEAALHLSEHYNGPRRPSRTNTMRGSMTGSMTLNSPAEASTVVILAGNHDIGARALAAARQLLGRNVKIIAVESTFESAATQHPHVRGQRDVLRKLALAGAKIKRGAWHKCQRAIKNLTGPPAVIIDALLAGATYQSLLEPNADFSARIQQETREMIDWANRSRAPVLSVGCPSGTSGIDGVSTIVEGEPLAVRPDRVLALGAPMTGLLKSIEGGERWKVKLADIGINIGLKAEDQVVFGESWTVDLNFVESDEAALTS
ncbi:Putative YjeF domain, FDF domain, DFDF domain, YjeF domain superfamily protein [Septoria linicola]|uniref:Enhancer of mRNA-decapping protein 3 n=1 Tax=Septoria linicola TaxID=215465 RepID=A0A9Q9EHI7_9PEZI|nr:putative YjeF domain, FDF domain, DFDF domain, YjeF domain superfamily protein [Septoria linicola]USW50054.1 Putative YjeF domain, FDF domain, DFDF domain, YjeF domain superfamily protein [Septoria linicola]